MKTVYKYIHFTEVVRKTQDQHKRVFQCVNSKHGTPLGTVTYYDNWHQWVFSQEKEGIVFNDLCLLDIADFLHQLNKK